MRLARASDGEAFALLTSNETLAARINLDLPLVEAEQVPAAHTDALRVAILAGNEVCREVD